MKLQRPESGSTSWQGDYSTFVGLSRPFSFRGGHWCSISGAGLFHFGRNSGGNYYYDRVPCCFGWSVEFLHKASRT